ncbi:MAG: hypothetical protein KDD25_02025 [Bdellovibrionales bacterium]|nr:hypothetical protein [Bdellovibrionales bacterium]
MENVSHGYPNCAACHVSPSGGGLLTDYGRSLSKELMSTWSLGMSEDPFFGLVKNTENIKLGGDVRTIQTYLENENVKQGKYFLMQSNLELGLTYGGLWAIGTVGTKEGPNETEDKGTFLSERHYLMLELSEDSRVRAGKFRQTFGLNDPNHTRVTKAFTGFGLNTETYNLEVFKAWETHEVTFSSSLGRLDIPRDESSERNFSLTFAHYLGGSSKLGTSYLIGESDLQRRSLADLFGAISFLERGIWKFDLVYEQSTPESDHDTKDKQLATFTSLGYQVAKGLTPYLVYEFVQTDLDEVDSKQYRPGVGFQWLPFPHFEIQSEYKYQTVESDKGNPNHVGWILFHLYI